MSEEVCNERIDWRAVAGVRRARGQRGVARFRQARPSARGCEFVEERETKLLALRAALDDSIARGGEVTDAELDAALGARSAELRRKGVGEGGERGFSRPFPPTFSPFSPMPGNPQEASPSAKPSWPNCAPNVMRWLRCKRRSGRPRPELRPSPVMTRLVPVIHVDPRSAAGRFVASARLALQATYRLRVVHYDVDGRDKNGGPHSMGGGRGV